jgi:hypothetical protein
VALASFSSCLGFIFGKAHNLSIHTEFVKTLEDPQGFSRALQNVNIRLGGTSYWTYDISLKTGRPVIAPSVKQSPSPTKEEHELSEQQDETMSWDSSPAPAPSSIPIKSAPKNTGIVYMMFVNLLLTIRHRYFPSSGALGSDSGGK